MTVELYKNRFIRLSGLYGPVIEIAKIFMAHGARCVALCGVKHGSRSRVTVVMEA